MLISPPFLLEPNVNESDADFIARCMPDTTVMVQGTSVPEGSFPISFKLGWHGGLHLQAPADGSGTVQNVRAVADGEIIYARRPTPQNANPSPAEPRNYNPYGADPAWTDDGCVIIRHTTDIGADAQDQAVSVTFLSIYLHLSELRGPAHTAAATNQNQTVYRKDEIGVAGMIYGTHHQLHFEIVCDDDNLQRLINRINGNLATGADGRTDAVFGEMYFCLPAGTPFFAERPMDNNSAAQRPAQPPATNPTPLTAAYTSTETLYVGLRYTSDGAAADRGNAVLTTYQEDGAAVGSQPPEPAAEYNLYDRATAISNAYPAANRPAPSAVYELLRFGRVIGPDALNPADVPHWREVRYPGGAGWVNLNATGITKFSDADFPHWRGWQLIADDIDGDSRCDSSALLTFIKTAADPNAAPSWQPGDFSWNDLAPPAGGGASNATDQGWTATIESSDADSNLPATPSVPPPPPVPKFTRAEFERRLQLAEVRAAFKRTICKFPTELDQASTDFRWGWLKSDPQFGLSETDFKEFTDHVNTLTFPWAAANTGLLPSHWHFEPREFISLWRKCGWRSQRELLQLVPKNIIRKPGSHNSSSQGHWESPPIGPANTLLSTHAPELNKALRKFCIDTPIRQACFFGNAVQETQWFRYLRESNGGQPTLHQGWYGRGYLQLTNPNGAINGGNNNYYKYFRFLGRSPVVPPGTQETTWRDQVGTDAYHAAHSAGAYWVWSNKSAPTSQNPNLPQVDNANKYADVPAPNERRTIATTSAGTKSWYYNQSFTNCAAAVNYPATVTQNPPNMNGLVDRSTAFANALMVLADVATFPDVQGIQQRTPLNFTRRVVT